MKNNTPSDDLPSEDDIIRGLPSELSEADKLRLARVALRSIKAQKVHDAFMQLCLCVADPDPDDPASRVAWEVADFVFADRGNHDEAIEAAFNLGKQHPDSNRFDVRWGIYTFWFFGTEEEVLKRINDAMWSVDY